jgi:hypothetical protein
MNSNVGSVSKSVRSSGAYTTRGFFLFEIHLFSVRPGLPSSVLPSRLPFSGFLGIGVHVGCEHSNVGRVGGIHVRPVVFMNA